MNDDFDVTVERVEIAGAKIAVVGVGGAGGNMLNTLAESDPEGDITRIAINTDAQALQTANAHHKIQLGPKTTAGKGAGGDPEVGKRAALESYGEIVDVLKGV